MTLYAGQEWVLVDRITVSANSSNKSFKSGGDGVTNYPVDGSKDGGYRITWSLTTSGASTCSLGINAGTTNCTYNLMRPNASTVTHATGSSLHPMAGLNSSEVTMGGVECLISATGATRVLRSYGGSFAGSTRYTLWGMGKYNDTSTNITDLFLNFTGVGTSTGTFWLWVRSPQQAPLLGADWICVDRIDLSAAATLKEFKSGGNGVMNYPVDGDKDGGYMLIWDLKGNASTGTGCVLNINTGATNQNVTRLVSTGGAAPTTSNGANMGNLTNSATGGSRHSGWFIMESSATGVNRSGFMYRGSNGAAVAAEIDFGTYADTSTNITTLGINTSVGDSTGSVWLYVKSPQQAGLIGAK